MFTRRVLIGILSAGLVLNVVMLFYLPQPDTHPPHPPRTAACTGGLEMCGETAATSERVLLPDNVTPVHYDLKIAPDLTKLVFDGTVVIDVTVHTPTSTIVVHANDITFDSAVVRGDGGSSSELTASAITVDKESECATLTFPQELAAGSATLTIVFTGVLNDQMAGFYRSKYTLDGVEKNAACTQFEPTDARRAFPCWDEPAVKATFDVTLVVPADLVALANMPVKSERVDGGVKTLVYERTPKMSTYLLAFVVGEYDFVETTTKGGVLFRVYTERGRTELGQFALDVGSRVLDYFSEYFDIPFPLPKQDMIAINDFAAGAMENWGLITYRETALLIDPAKSSQSQKQRVAYVVAHELAHQWFGNLVTMEWWEHLWLNEGFATYIGTQAVDFLFPEWDVWTQFATDYISSAQALDALESSHPIEVPVKSSGEINEIFDAISYCKGASVIRMVAKFLGEENFQKGLITYLKRHMFENAATDDLWRAWSEVSGQDVKEFMSVWTRKVGYPVLSASLDGTTLSLQQQRFLASGPTDDDTAWWISLDVGNSDGKTTTVTLKEREGAIELPADVAAGDWVKLNLERVAFLRTKYSDDMIAKLTKGIENKSLTKLDRLGVQADAMQLAKAGLASTATALTVAKAYSGETDLTVWSDLTSNLRQVGIILADDDEASTAFKAFLAKLYRPAYETLGFDAKEGESGLDAQLRPIVIAMLGAAGDAEVIAEAQKRFANGDGLGADLQQAVFNIVIANGGEAEFAAVQKVFETADMHEERVRALKALAKADAALVQTLFTYMQSGKVRSQDKYLVFAIAGLNGKAKRAAWDFLTQNWDAFKGEYEGGAFLFGRIIKCAVAAFAGEDDEATVSKFFADMSEPVKGIERAVAQATEGIRSNAQWRKRDLAAVKAWLQANQ